MPFDFIIVLFHVAQEAGLLDQRHILDLVGVGTPGATAVYFYFTRKESKDKDEQITMWKAEADKYQAKWIEAVEKLEPNE